MTWQPFNDAKNWKKRLYTLSTHKYKFSIIYFFVLFLEHALRVTHMVPVGDQVPAVG